MDFVVNVIMEMYALVDASNTRLCMEDSIYKENKYCSYYIAMNRKKKK